MEKLNKIYRTADVPRMDAYTIDSENISSWELMERAARIWADFFSENMKNKVPVIVIAGRGNNGGDGYAIARMLYLKGVDIEVVCLPSEHGFSKDCEKNRKLWENIGGNTTFVESPEQWKPCREAVLIDAIFGSGLNRPVKGVIAEMIHQMNKLPNVVYAVDIPSGLMGEDNSLNDSTSIVRADYTYTFQFPKLSFLLPANASYVGEWFVLNIDLKTDVVEPLGECTSLETVQKLLPSPGKFDHKGVNGRGLLVAGSYGMAGAAVLASSGALHAGIGVLHCHVPADCVNVLQIAVPEAVLDIDTSRKHCAHVSDLEIYNAVAIGPGLGKHEETVNVVRKLMQTWDGPMIIDADGLNIIAEHPELLTYLHERCLLTPHVKEFERLVGKCANDFVRLNKLVIFAKQYKVYLILKGAYSVVATPEGKIFFNMSGNPGMAKGGSGDVLTGILLALAANGLNLLDVARIGVFVHGLAADILVEEYGFRGITSGMLAQELGHAWKRIEKKIIDKI